MPLLDCDVSPAGDHTDNGEEGRKSNPIVCHRLSRNARIGDPAKGKTQHREVGPVLNENGAYAEARRLGAVVVQFIIDHGTISGIGRRCSSGQAAHWRSNFSAYGIGRIAPSILPKDPVPWFKRTGHWKRCVTRDVKPRTALSVNSSATFTQNAETTSRPPDRKQLDSTAC